MALTRPPLSFLNTNSTVFSDPLLVLHQGSDSSDSDVGFVFNRANGLVANVALYWSEADKAFYTTFTNSGGATDANLVPTTYANLVTNVLSANTISTSGDFTTTGNITGGNLITTGTVTVDRLSLSSSQTTVPPLQLTASSLQDGVGALRIDGSQADIFLNPATATHTTVTFAVNNDQRLAFGMDNNSDFYITRRTGGSWYDDTLVIDRDSGQVALGYDLLVSGDATVTGNLTVNGTTTTVSSTNTLVSDSLMELNTGAGSNANDLGFIFERGSTGDNAAIIWDESADAFVLGTTTATGASTGDLTITTGELRLDTLRIDQSGTGLRMTNVGAFDNDGSDNFRVFATNDLKIAANGDSGTAITIDATNQDVTITNDLRVTAGQFYYGGTAITATATELNYVDGVTSSIQTQLDAKLALAGGTMTGNIVMPANGTIGTSTGNAFVKFSETSTSYSGVNLSMGSYQGAHVLLDMNAGDANGATFTVRTGATSIDSATELFKIDGTGATFADGTRDVDIASHDGTNGLKLGGTLITATAAELNYVDGVTSSIQTQIDGKLSLTGGTVSGATTFQNTVNISGGSAVLQIGGASITASAAELNLLDGVTATTAEINYLDGVTSNIQTQLDAAGGITEAQAIEYAIALG